MSEIFNILSKGAEMSDTRETPTAKSAAATLAELALLNAPDAQSGGVSVVLPASKD